MGMFAFSKPAWKSPEADIRLKAVASLAERPQLLLDLATRDPDTRVRAAAAHLVRGEADLQRLLSGSDPEVQRIAGERLSGVADRLLRDKPFAECRALLDRVNDQKSLAELSVHARDGQVRSAALEKLLAQPQPSEALLVLVAVQDADGAQARRALERISRKGALKDVARKAKVDAVRSAAAAKAEQVAIEEERPSSEQVQAARRKALPPLLDQALRLAVGADVEANAPAWGPLVGQWQGILGDRPDVALAEDLVELDRRFQRTKAEFDERLSSERARIAQGRQAREAFLMGLQSREVVEAETSIAQRRELEQNWAALGHLPEAVGAPLTERFRRELDRLCPAPVAPEPAVPAPLISDADAAELERICAEAEALVAGGREARFRYQELHKQWSKYSSPLPQDHVFKQRFLAAFVAHKDHRRQSREDRSSAAQQRLSDLDLLVAEAERLAGAVGSIPAHETETLKAHANALKGLQQRWKSVGYVPPTEHGPRRDRFFAAMDTAWEPVEAMREAETWERFTHLAHAEELIVQVEALAQNEDLAAVANAVKRAHQDWKALGSLPRDKGQEAWSRFKTACDAQFERCRPFFAEQDVQRGKNLEEKQGLLTTLQELVDFQPAGLPGSPVWIQQRKDQHEKMKTLQERWKTIGPVPREHEDSTWQAYRALLDRHFAAHREEMSQRHSEQVENANHKLALIVAAEDLAKAAEAGVANPSLARPPEKTIAAVKDLQQQWKNIGHVPREQVESTWLRWKTALDRVYATLKDHLAEQEAEREANAAKKEALITEAIELAQHENPGWFKEDIKELQRKWRDIGHVPRNRMDDLNDRFRAACDKVFSA